MRILAVDDDPFIVELVPKIAASIGLPEVSTALSGEEALSAIAAADCPYDCLLLVFGKDGIDVCASVRSIPAYRKTPIIMLAAKDEETFIDHAFRAGATDYATKPLDSVEFGAKLRAAQSINSAQRHAASVIELRHADQIGGRVFDLSGEISVDGSGKLVAYPDLKRHLIGLPRTSLMSSQLVAVKIDQFDAILARASSGEFLYALSETVDAIGEVFRPFGYMMAYAGRGIFAVVSNKATLEPSTTAERDIQYLLDERNLEYDNGDPLDIDVSIGNPMRPTVTKMRRATRSFDLAIARAESRSARKKTEPRPPSIRIFR